MKVRGTCTENKEQQLETMSWVGDRELVVSWKVGWGAFEGDDEAKMAKQSMMTLILALCNSALEYKQCAHAVRISEC